MSPIEKLYQADKVLIFFTHPDDEVLIAPIIKKLNNVHIIYTVDGVPGDCFNNQCVSKPLAVVRQDELAKSAAELGFTYELAHLPFVGNASSLGEQLSIWQGATAGYLNAAIQRIVIEYKPDVILTFHPRHGTTTFNDNTVSEHIATGQAVLNALPGFKNIVLVDHRLDIRDGKIGFKQGTVGSQAMQCDIAGWNLMVHLMQDVYKSQFEPSWIAGCEASTGDMRYLYFIDA